MTRLILTLLMLVAAGDLRAGIYLDRIIVKFSPEDRNRQDIVVFNDSDSENAFVEISVLEVVNPGQENQEMVAVTDPRKSQFLVTPAKLVIPPGGKKQVRLVDMKKSGSNSERVFRVTFTPVLPPLTEESSMIRVVVSYQSLILIPPNEVATDLHASRNGTTLTLTNKGNSFVMLEDGEQCDAAGECVEIPGKRLYAGNRLEMALPHDAPVTFQTTTYEGVKKLTID